MGGMGKGSSKSQQHEGPLAQLIPYIVNAAQRTQQLGNRYVPGDVTPGRRPEHAYGGPGTPAVGRPRGMSMSGGMGGNMGGGMPGGMPGGMSGGMPGGSVLPGRMPNPLPFNPDILPDPARKPITAASLGGGGKGK